jgi:hypothetical protein
MQGDTDHEMYDFDAIYQVLPLGFVTMLSAELAARGRDVDAYEYLRQEMPGEIKEDLCRIIFMGESAIAQIKTLKLTDPADVDSELGSVSWRARCDMWRTLVSWAHMSHDKSLLLNAAGGALK